MPCQDCLIWVGKSYRSVAEYVEEARTRGCSRQVPFWPSWAVPGETRVFLAHSDSFIRYDKGVIFGYFVLKGVDIILRQPDCDAYKLLPDNSDKFDFWQKKLPRALPFKAGGAGRGGGKRDGKKSDDELEDALDFLLDFLISCEPEPDPTGHCGYGISTTQTALEEGRFCGVRLGPEKKSSDGRPAIYFVDALAREIDEMFCELLKELIKEGIKAVLEREPRKRRKDVPEEERKKIEAEVVARLREEAEAPLDRRRQKGIKQFREAANKVLGAKTDWAEIPAAFERHAHARGSLVVFDEPYPVFHMWPTTEIRGMVRLDGDELLERIAHTYDGEGAGREVELPYCADDETPDVDTKPKSWWVNEMSSELQVNKELANKVLDWLGEKVTEQLRSGTRAKLQDIGSIWVKIKKGRKVGVKFNPSKKLKTGIPLEAAPAGRKKRRKK